MPSKDSYHEITFVILAGIIVFLVLTGMVVFILLYYQKKKFQDQKRMVEMEKHYTEELLRTKLEIQEETFRNISQEIHDNIGQALSFVKLNLGTVDAYNAEEVKEKLAESKNLLSKTIHDLRDIARSLSPDFLNEIGLCSSIEQQLQLLDKTDQYKTSFTVEGEIYKNDQQQELVVFRIVQELLNNIVKHAEANAINVKINYLPEKLMITVQDNGKGFDTKAMQSSKDNNGLGLRNMLNRMTLINGFININSKPGEGTTAEIDLPKAPAS
jgi:two-component system NarL family sensor kinase